MNEQQKPDPQTTPFKPVATLSDLDALDHDEILAGYTEWRSGDPEPGANRGRAYWHGWMNAARDHYERPNIPEAGQLAGECLARMERERKNG